RHGPLGLSDEIHESLVRKRFVHQERLDAAYPGFMRALSEDLSVKLLAHLSVGDFLRNLWIRAHDTRGVAEGVGLNLNLTWKWRGMVRRQDVRVWTRYLRQLCNGLGQNLFPFLAQPVNARGLEHPC